MNNEYTTLTEKILLEKLTTKTLMLEDDLKEVSTYLDEDSIKEVFKRAYTHIGDMLHEEHGYSESEIERKLEDIFNDTKKYTGAIVKKSRSKEIKDKLFTVHQDSDSKIFSYSDFGKKEVEDVSKLKNEILTSTPQVIENAPSDQSNTLALIEDTISNEMKYQIKRALNIDEDPRGEEAFYEVSRYIDSRLSPDMVEAYLSGTRSLNKSLEELYSDLLDEIVTEYSIEKEQQQESNSIEESEQIKEDRVEETTKTNFQQSLQNATKTEDEIAKIDTNTITSEVYKQKTKDDKSITDIIE